MRTTIHFLVVLIARGRNFLAEVSFQLGFVLASAAASEATPHKYHHIPLFLLEMNKEIKAMASELLHIQEKAVAAAASRVASPASIATILRFDGCYRE